MKANLLRRIPGAGLCLLVLLMAGCGSAPKKPDGLPTVTTQPPPAPSVARPGGYYQDDGPGENPPNLDSIPDAIPRDEPLHRGANKPYTVLGKTYVPNVATEPFRQEGIASWYGRKFHGQKTSTGETYDMFAMTAAHPTLPLPSYVRVTNPGNQASVVVRVNDRGPFHSDRIIDLSYAAAHRLDIARKGSGRVVIERVFEGQPAVTSAAVQVTPLGQASAIAATPIAANLAQPLSQAVTPSAVSPVSVEAGTVYLQLGAFSSADNAEIFRARMARELGGFNRPGEELIHVLHKDGLHRVRMGPYKSREDAEAVAAKVRAQHDFSPIISKP